MFLLHKRNTIRNSIGSHDGDSPVPKDDYCDCGKIRRKNVEKIELSKEQSIKKLIRSRLCLQHLTNVRHYI